MSVLPITCRDDERRRLVREAALNGVDYVEVSDDQLRLCVHFLASIPPRSPQGERARSWAADASATSSSPGSAADPLRIPISTTASRSRLIATATSRPTSSASSPSTARASRPADPTRASISATPASTSRSRRGARAPSTASPPTCARRRWATSRPSTISPRTTRRSAGCSSIGSRSWCRTGASGTSPISASRSWSCSRTSATNSATTRTRSRPRRTSTPRGSGISVRRHARLVDYVLHEGCNARAFVVVEVHGAPLSRMPDELEFLTAYPGAPSPGTLLDANDMAAPAATAACFEPIVDDRAVELVFREELNQIALYTWGDRECCLPKGSTSAWLVDGKQEEPPPAVDTHRLGSDGHIRRATPATARRRLPAVRGDRRTGHRERGRAPTGTTDRSSASPR